MRTPTKKKLRKYQTEITELNSIITSLKNSTEQQKTRSSRRKDHWAQRQSNGIQWIKRAGLKKKELKTTDY